MLQRGDATPHFEVSTIGGDVFRYSDIWQQKNLVLVALPSSNTDASAYAAALSGRDSEFKTRESACVVTRDTVPGLPAPALLVADRWGEIVFTAAASQVAGLPTPQDLLDWIEHIENRCPECEGEAM